MRETHKKYLLMLKGKHNGWDIIPPAKLDGHIKEFKKIAILQSNVYNQKTQFLTVLHLYMATWLGVQ